MDDLLHTVNWNNRWSYSGSLTTPPCWVKIQHNVLRQVLPIKEEHISALRTFTEANYGVDGENFYDVTAGNWRVILDITEGADAVYITDEAPPVKMYRDLFAAFLVLFIVALLGLFVTCYMWTKAVAAAPGATRPCGRCHVRRQR